ncbi:hypothetical protein GJAV_G00218300 [Gymnothorax javanicus]|nr:hypothetical protein GJAV_G00218300 [Gymnothorax javanicus]
MLNYLPQKQLKKRFPSERSSGKRERVIPKFRGGPVQGQKKGPSKSMIRLKLLEKYFDQLLKCDPQIIQSTELAQFFLPAAHDLQPEFAKNSIVIMPSEDINEDQKSSGTGNVSQPFVTETYRCVAAYETKDTKNRPFKVSLDEKLDVLIKDKAGWWLVENNNKCMAWFPAPYLEKCEDEDSEEDGGSETPEEGVLYCAVRNFSSTKADEASLSIGSVVEVLQKSDNGWWLIRYKGKVGYAPSMYLKPYSNPKMRLVTMQNEMRSSTLNLSQLQAPGASLAPPGPGIKPSRSCGNLPQLQVPGSSLAPPQSGPGMKPSRSYSNLLLPEDRQPSNLGVREQQRVRRQRSLSLEQVEEPRPRRHSAQPTIRVERPPEEESGLGDQQCSSEWDSDEISEFSFSDESSGPEQFSISMPESSWRGRRALTPQPNVAPNDRLAPSKSETDLFKGPAIPKVPPRPGTQEILTRCSTITRKAAQSPTKNQLTLEAGIIQSR